MGVHHVQPQAGAVLEFSTTDLAEDDGFLFDHAFGHLLVEAVRLAERRMLRKHFIRLNTVNAREVLVERGTLCETLIAQQARERLIIVGGSILLRRGYRRPRHLSNITRGGRFCGDACTGRRSDTYSYETRCS